MNDFKAVLDAAPDGMIVVGAAGGITLVNRQAERMFGYAQADLIGKPVEVLIPSRFSRTHTVHRTQYFDVPRVRPMGAGVQLFARRHDGTEFPCEISLSPLEIDGAKHAIAAIRDITDRVRNENQLRRILDSAPDAIVIADHNGVITFANQQSERLFGYAPRELVGRPIEMLVPQRFGEVHPRHRQKYFQQPRVRPMGAGLRLFACRKDGSEFPCEISLSPLETDEGIQAMAAVRDITERITFEERERQLEREKEGRQAAESAVKLRDEFLSIASHELRTPLSSLFMRLELILRKSKKAALPAEIVESLELPLAGAKRLMHLIDQLLDVSRITSNRLSLEVGATDLAAIVRAVVDQSSDAGPPITYEGPTSLIGSWDGSRIEQVVTNLVSNAIKYGDQQPIEIRLIHEAPDTAVLSVQDHGIGIAPDEQARIFERFERAVSGQTYAGLGLGLFISQEIVARHGGSISVTSKVGQGSTFIVRLPCTAKPQAKGEDHDVKTNL